MDTLAHTCLRMGPLRGTWPPAGNRCSYTPLMCLQLGLCISIFIEPVQKHLSGGLGGGEGGRQARLGQGPRRMLGRGLGLEMWKNRDSLPLRICRACPLLLKSGSLGNGAADCPSVSPFLPLQAGGRWVLGGLGLGSCILGGPCGLRLGGHGFFSLVPVSAGFLELVPPCHLSFQVLQVFLAE